MQEHFFKIKFESLNNFYVSVILEHSIFQKIFTPPQDEKALLDLQESQQAFKNLITEFITSINLTFSDDAQLTSTQLRKKYFLITNATKQYREVANKLQLILPKHMMDETFLKRLTGINNFFVSGIQPLLNKILTTIEQIDPKKDSSMIEDSYKRLKDTITELLTMVNNQLPNTELSIDQHQHKENYIRSLMNYDQIATQKIKEAIAQRINDINNNHQSFYMRPMAIDITEQSMDTTETSNTNTVVKNIIQLDNNDPNSPNSSKYSPTFFPELPPESTFLLWDDLLDGNPSEQDNGFIC